MIIMNFSTRVTESLIAFVEERVDDEANVNEAVYSPR